MSSEVEYAPTGERLAKAPWTLAGIAERTPAEARCFPTNVLDQWPGKVMPTDLVEQKPTAVEYAPTDGVPAEVILIPTGVVEQTSVYSTEYLEMSLVCGFRRPMPQD